MVTLRLALQNLLVAKLDQNGVLVRSFTILNIVSIGVLMAIFWLHHIPPPLVTLAIVELLFVLAIMIPNRREEKDEGGEEKDEG
jgi:hypothetical protein